MEEAFVSGYCRKMDRSVIVAVELDGRSSRPADCDYGRCPHEESCAVAEKIRKLLKSE